MHTLINASKLPLRRACDALGLSPATAYRLRQPKGVRCTVRQASHRRLPETLREAILDALHSPRFCDQTPTHTYHSLLDEGTYLASVRTMQRVLKDVVNAGQICPP